MQIFNEIDPIDLADIMAFQLSYSELIDFVKELDVQVGDSEFTKRLRKALQPDPTFVVTYSDPEARMGGVEYFDGLEVALSFVENYPSWTIVRRIDDDV